MGKPSKRFKKCMEAQKQWIADVESDAERIKADAEKAIIKSSPDMPPPDARAKADAV